MTKPANEQPKRRREARAAGTDVWFALIEAHRSLDRHAVSTTDAAGMGLSEFKILELLSEDGPQPVNEIGRRINLASGSITSAVDRLENRGLVARGFEAADRRTRIVSLTKEGEALIARTFASHKAAMAKATSGLTKDERVALISLLKKVCLSADERPAGQN